MEEMEPQALAQALRPDTPYSLRGSSVDTQLLGAQVEAKTSGRLEAGSGRIGCDIWRRY